MQALHHLNSYLPSQFAPSHFLEADTTGHHFVPCEENQPHNWYSLHSFVPYSDEHLLLVPWKLTTYAQIREEELQEQLK